MSRVHESFKETIQRPEESALFQSGVTTALPLVPGVPIGIIIHLPGLLVDLASLISSLGHCLGLIWPKAMMALPVRQSGETVQEAYVVTDKTLWDIVLSVLMGTCTYLLLIFPAVCFFGKNVLQLFH